MGIVDDWSGSGMGERLPVAAAEGSVQAVNPRGSRIVVPSSNFVEGGLLPLSPSRSKRHVRLRA